MWVMHVNLLYFSIYSVLSPFDNWISPLFQMSIDPNWSRWNRLHIAVQLRTLKMEAPRGDDG